MLNTAMKVFDGRKAAEDYMSVHTLTFSTPDLTLKRFAFWLGDNVPNPDGEGTIPRAYVYVTEQDFAPVQVVDDDHYEPSGAVLNAKIYGNVQTESSYEAKFCPECGAKASATAKFCPKCGSTQD